jgi:hypothetical protein
VAQGEGPELKPHYCKKKKKIKERKKEKERKKRNLLASGSKKSEVIQA